MMHATLPPQDANPSCMDGPLQSLLLQLVPEADSRGTVLVHSWGTEASAQKRAHPLGKSFLFPSPRNPHISDAFCRSTTQRDLVTRVEVNLTASYFFYVPTSLALMEFRPIWCKSGPATSSEKCLARSPIQQTSPKNSQRDILA